MFCLYIVTSPYYMLQNIVKLGMSEDLNGRRSTYQTSCPPGLLPYSHDIDYYAVWETNAITRDDLFHYEDVLHNQFIKFRMMRNIPGDSEWFHFESHPVETVKHFLNKMQWVKREVPLSEIKPLKRLSHRLQKQCSKNTNFIQTNVKRIEALNQIQEPVIEAIHQFVRNNSLYAGFLIAPCGSGKTRMTCEGIKGLKKVIICCPSNQIQSQWASTLTFENILTIGSTNNGTTNLDVIRTFMKQETFCIISTYMSSYLLLDVINDVEIIVLDEAHHLGGIIGNEENGEGKTRRLMMKATNLKIKRLSLTFTPRIVRKDSTTDIEFASMDDINIFGSQIAELKIRELIKKGVLPDYRIWSLRDSLAERTGIVCKAECILESWESKQMVRGVEEYILHHLIIFASTNDEANQLEEYFTNNTKDTLVLCVKGGDKLRDPLCKFSEAKRAIIVNCKVLGEGVDIPVANAVAITYPKHSIGEITQMLLRAGRWYSGKSIFHILLPVIDEDDMTGFEDVLMALASCDDQLRDEVILRSRKFAINEQKLNHSVESFDSYTTECIMIDEYDGSKMDEIRKCFINIKKKLFPVSESNKIQELCIKEGIDTSTEYNMLLRTEIPELPEDPRLKKSTWFDYLHPTNDKQQRISVEEFSVIIKSKSLATGHIYDEWRGLQPSDIRVKLPFTQHITDGYFGIEITNFNDINNKFGKTKQRR
jgi:superfamily II DNA or RNA helicase